MKYTLGDLTVRRWNDWDRVPRMPEVVIPYIASALTVSTVTATIIYYVGTTLITSWALNALAPKPDFGSLTSSGILVNAKDATAPADFVYGEVRKGGVVTYYESTGEANKYLHQIIVLAAHEVNSIGDIYIHDTVVTLDGSGFVTSDGWDSKIRIQKFDGSQTTAPADLLSESELTGDDALTSNFIGNGLAYLYVRYEYDQNVFASGIPLITAVVQGKKVYDPRTTNTAYSNNAALCIRDFLTASYGLNDDAIDDVAFAAAANECDESVALDAGGTESRYTINGIVRSDRAVGDVLGDMMAACAGTLFWGSGYWKLKAGAYSSPVKTLTLDDLRGPISLDTRITLRDNFNEVQGTFNDASQDWITVDYPKLTSATFLTEDGGAGNETALDLQLPYTTSAATAQRLAKLTLFRGREQMTVSAEFGMNAFDIEVGDIIALDNDRYGWTAKEFEVVGWRLAANQDAGDLRVALTLRETSAAAFDWNAEESAIVANNTTLPVFTAGNTVSNLSISGGGNTQGDGTFINSAIVSWDAVNNSYAERYEVQWRRTSDSTYASTFTTDTSIELSPLVDGVEYTFRVRVITANGYRGSFSSGTFTGGGDTAAPALPTGLSVVGILGGFEISWTNPADADFSHVEVYESADNVFANAVEIGRSSGNNFIRNNLSPATTKYYWVRAVDFSGNPSTIAEAQFTGPQSGITKLVTATDLADAAVDYENLAISLRDTLDDKAETSDLSNYVETADYELSVDALQILDDNSEILAEKALEFFTQASTLESRINDAGIVVNPVDGQVTIQAVSSLEEVVSQVSLDLDAAETAIQLRATQTYVNEQIDAAVLDSADLASLNNLEARVDTAEITLDGGGDILAAQAMVAGETYTIYTVGTTDFTQFGATSNTVNHTFYCTGAGTGTGQVQVAGQTARVDLTASGTVYRVVDGQVEINDVQTQISTLQGEIVLKATESDLTALTTRVSEAEIDINAIDAPSISLNLIETKALYDQVEELGELSLRDVLDRYRDRKVAQADLASARLSLTADVNDEREARATSELELVAAIDDNLAVIEETKTALATETTSRVEAETLLQANIDGVDTTLNEVITLDATAGHAVVDQFLTLKADVEDPETGLVAAHGDITELNTVNVTSTSALVQAHLELDGVVNDPTTGLAAAQASIDQINTVDVTSDSAAAVALATLEASVNDPTTGLSATRATLINDYYTSADADSAISSAITSNNVTIGETYATITTVNTVSGEVDDLQAKYGVEIDSNGIISGFQLLSGAGTASAFNVRADQFNIYSVDGTTSAPAFSVRTSSETVGGITYPQGVYFDGLLSGDQIVAGTITAGDITVAQISDLSSDLGTFTASEAAGSVEISSTGIIVKDGSGTVRVKIGKL